MTGIHTGNINVFFLCSTLTSKIGPIAKGVNNWKQLNKNVASLQILCVIWYMIKPDELSILSCEKGGGRKPGPFSQLRMESPKGFNWLKTHPTIIRIPHNHDNQQLVHTLLIIAPSQQTQNICITSVQRRLTLYKSYTNVLCLFLNNNVLFWQLHITPLHVY